MHDTTLQCRTSLGSPTSVSDCSCLFHLRHLGTGADDFCRLGLWKMEDIRVCCGAIKWAAHAIFYHVTFDLASSGRWRYMMWRMITATFNSPHCLHSDTVSLNTNTPRRFITQRIKNRCKIVRNSNASSTLSSKAYFDSLNGGTNVPPLSGFVPPLKCVPPLILSGGLRLNL